MSFSENVIAIIKGIPKGKVISYGQIAAIAGNHRAARQVASILKKNSENQNLPWHRVVNSKRSISLTPSMGGTIQKELLISEGIEFTKKGTIIEKEFFWNGPFLL